MEVVPQRKDLAGRLADVFGALGGSEGGPTPWSLPTTSRPFNAGRPVTADDVDSDEEPVPGQIMPQSEIDSEEEEPGAVCIRSSYRAQFEQEAEEDEYDRFADEGWSGLDVEANSSKRPSGTTEVPDDNQFDRMSELRQCTAAAAEQDVQAMDVEQEPVASAPAACIVAPPDDVSALPAAASPSHTTAPAAQRVSVFSSARLERPPPKPCIAPAVEPHAPGQGAASGAASGAAAGQEGDERVRKAARRASGRRVCFAEDVQGGLDAVPSAAAAALSRPDQQQWPAGRGGRNGGGRRGGNRQVVLNWQRPGFVPEYVKHPERYTRYDLGESLTVGGGEQGVTSAGGQPERWSLTAEAATLRQAVAAAQHVVALEEGGMEQRQEAAAAPLAVGKGAVKFVPKAGKVKAGDASSAAAPRPAGAAAGGLPVQLQYDGEEGDGGAAGGGDVLMGDVEQVAGGPEAVPERQAAGRQAGRRKFRTSKTTDAAEAGPGDM